MNVKFNNELVSIVIPSFNHQCYIKFAIDSILNQSYENVECIVIDDGSSDDSPDYLNDLYAEDPRVRLYARENRGAHNTINEAMAASRGEFIGILNSDDIYSLNRVEKLVNAARATASPSFFITAISVIDESANPAPTTGPALYYESICKKAAGGPPNCIFWVGNIAMTTSNFFFPRTIYEKIGGFRSLRYTHDWDWALRASEDFPIIRLDEQLLSYRVHASNTISENNIWKHIVENAVIFAAAFLRQSSSNRGKRTNLSSEKVMSYFLKNESFLPLAVLYLLGSGRKEEELFSGLSDLSIEDELKSLHKESELPLDLFLSAPHLSNMIASNIKECDISPSAENKSNDPNNTLWSKIRRIWQAGASR